MDSRGLVAAFDLWRKALIINKMVTGNTQVKKFPLEEVLSSKLLTRIPTYPVFIGTHPGLELGENVSLHWTLAERVPEAIAVDVVGSFDACTLIFV